MLHPTAIHKMPVSIEQEEVGGAGGSRFIPAESATTSARAAAKSRSLTIFPSRSDSENDRISVPSASMVDGVSDIVPIMNQVRGTAFQVLWLGALRAALKGRPKSAQMISTTWRPDIVATGTPPPGSTHCPAM